MLEPTAAGTRPWAEKMLARDRQMDLLWRPRVRKGGSAPHGKVDDRDVVVFSSSDYLGLSVHPRVREAAAQASLTRGVGSTGSRLLSGSHEELELFEQELASFIGTETATLVPSAYGANVSALTAVGGSDAVIFSDALNHASIIDGCRLARSKMVVFRRGDLDDLEQKLGRSWGRRIIVAETVFSMDGVTSDVRRLLELAHVYEAWLILDEAHATGVIGPGGRGAVAAAGVDVRDERLIRVVTLGEALGAVGGVVVGSELVRSLLIQRAHPMMFSTAPTLPAIAGARAALAVLREHPELVDSLQAKIHHFRTSLAALSPLGGADIANRAGGGRTPAASRRRRAADARCRVPGAGGKAADGPLPEQPATVLRLGSARRIGARGRVGGSAREPRTAR